MWLPKLYVSNIMYIHEIDIFDNININYFSRIPRAGAGAGAVPYQLRYLGILGRCIHRELIYMATLDVKYSISKPKPKSKKI